MKKAVTRGERRAGAARGRDRERVVAAADEVLAGALRDQFVVDVYQAGAGTSHNMNANEVLANRAGEMLGDARGGYERVHPNDHVNMGQSTNDVFPTATRRRAADGDRAARRGGAGTGGGVRNAGGGIADVLKVGRTHLQDAVPMTLGQEFGGYAACLEQAADEVVSRVRGADGTESRRDGRGHGSERRRRSDHARRSAPSPARRAWICARAVNRFRVTQSMGDVLAGSGAMRRLAVELARSPATCDC